MRLKHNIKPLKTIKYVWKITFALNSLKLLIGQTWWYKEEATVSNNIGILTTGIILFGQIWNPCLDQWARSYGGHVLCAQPGTKNNCEISQRCLDQTNRKKVYILDRLHATNCKCILAYISTPLLAENPVFKNNKGFSSLWTKKMQN